MRAPTSEVLERLIRDAPDGTVTLAWVVDRLQERSFGVLLLLLAAIALIPGLSTPIGVLLLVPAAQMLLARPEPVLPGRLARRRLPTQRLTRVIGRLVPVLRRLERVVRPRWATPFEATKRAVGLAVLLLALSMLSPIPFGHVPPILAITLLAVAFLEEDGKLLCIGLGAAAVSLAVTAAAVWGTIEAGRLL